MQIKIIGRVVEVISGLFILLFAYSAMSKLLGHDLFYRSLAQSPLLKEFASIIAWSLPIVELMACMLLFLPSTRLVGMYLSLFMMVSFTVYISYALLYIPHLPCSCGGVIRYMSWPQHLLFNLIFIVLGIIAIRNIRKEHRIEACRQA